MRGFEGVLDVGRDGRGAPAPVVGSAVVAGSTAIASMAISRPATLRGRPPHRR